MVTEKEYCPQCDKEITIKELNKNKVFRGVDIAYKYRVFFCPDCKLEVATTKQMGEMQRTISDLYREKVGLLTGKKIREYREYFGLSQKALADKMTVGIASIKRWEGGLIQSKSMDTALRKAFSESEFEYKNTSDMVISLQRVILILEHLGSLVNMHFLSDEMKQARIQEAKPLNLEEKRIIEIIAMDRDAGKNENSPNHAS